MIRPIMKSEVILAQPCVEVGASDLAVAQDLLDTLAAHRDTCVGMAANMIGVRKRIIVFVDGNAPRAMLNPEITSAQGPYQVKEGCLSLVGVRPALRYARVRVRWEDEEFRPHERVFTGRVASGDQFIRTDEKKEWIRSTFDASCAEMEGAAIAHTAYINNIPFAIVRLISDNADDDAAMTYEEIETKAAHLSAEMLFKVLEKLS